MRSPLTLFSDSISIVRTKFTTFLGLIAAPFIVIVVVAISGLLSVAQLSGELEAEQVGPFVFLLMFIVWLVFLLTFIGCLKVFASPNDTTIKTAYQFALKKFIPFFWVSLVTGFVIMAGYILFVLPGLIAAFFLSLASYIVLFEDVGAVTAMKRSFGYVKANWAGILYRYVAIVFIVMAIAFVVGIAAAIVGALLTTLPVVDVVFGIVMAVVAVFVPIVTNGYWYLLYTDARTFASVTPAPAQADAQPVQQTTYQSETPQPDQQSAQ